MLAEGPGKSSRVLQKSNSLAEGSEKNSRILQERKQRGRLRAEGSGKNSRILQEEKQKGRPTEGGPRTDLEEGDGGDPEEITECRCLLLLFL